MWNGVFFYRGFTLVLLYKFSVEFVKNATSLRMFVRHYYDRSILSWFRDYRSLHFCASASVGAFFVLRRDWNGYVSENVLSFI